MSDRDRQDLLEKQLGKYPIALDPEQVAEVLGVTRRYVDKLLDDGTIPSFVLNPDKQLKQKRVTKVDLIGFMLNKTNKTT